MAFNNRSNNYRGNNHRPNNRRPSYNNNSYDRPTYPAMATTPYNFVSLASKPLFHPLVEEFGREEWQKLDKALCQKEFAKYAAKSGSYTGHIDLTIKTLSPCFIGGEMKGDTKQFFTTDIAAHGTPVIPGSSLRGMFKNIFKLITCGVMRPNEDFADRHLYFRKIMASTSNKGDDTLQTHYEELTNKDNGGTKAGFLIRVKETGEYFVCPALYEKMDKFPTKKPRDVGGIYFHEGTEEKPPYAECITGDIKDKQHRHYITNPDFRKEARIPLEPELHIVENYEADKTRRGINILKYAKKDREASGFTKESDINLVTPCFYTEKGGFVQNFGHGPHYRVPYITSTKDHVPQELLAGEAPLDFADLVFGHKDYWATRVYFDDARPVKPAEVEYDSDEYTRPLMAPNPTSYQLYLRQSGNVGKNHWDTPQAMIRGYKFYWHRFADSEKTSWKKPADSKLVKGMTKIRPIKENTEFHGRVRFENLSEVELGALCSAIACQYGNHKIAYKIGMGKSIGMGSISIEPKLFLEDMKQHYSQLFAAGNGGWSKDCSSQDMAGFLTAFEQYRSQHLGPKGKDALLKTREELATLLDPENKDTSEWLKKTSMMQIGKGDKRFINRIALLEPAKFSKAVLK